MELREQIRQQRVKHIVSSYQLDGHDLASFSRYLKHLLENYPSPLIELALVEVLVDSWLRIPMQKGCDFLARVHDRICTWQERAIVSTISPEQFQQVTGLDPSPIFGTSRTAQISNRSLSTGF
jgi:hypothetical protein